MRRVLRRGQEGCRLQMHQGSGRSGAQGADTPSYDPEQNTVKPSQHTFGQWERDRTVMGKNAGEVGLRVGTNIARRERL